MVPNASVKYAIRDNVSRKSHCTNDVDYGYFRKEQFAMFYLDVTHIEGVVHLGTSNTRYFTLKTSNKRNVLDLYVVRNVVDDLSRRANGSYFLSRTMKIVIKS